MESTKWKKKIIKQVKEVGTYRAAFAPAIDALSEILAQRDATYADFLESGAQPCITKTSDRGATNVVKNPRLQVWIDLNSQALHYWKDLGLTPAGLKRLNETAIKAAPEKKPLESLIESIGI